MRAAFNFNGSYNIERNVQLNAQDCVNLYPVFDPEDKNGGALVKVPGIGNPLVINSGASNTRNGYEYRGDTYVVSEEKVYRINSLLIATHINPATPLSSFNGFVGITANQIQLIFVDGTNGYLYNPTSGIFSQIIDPNFPTNPVDVTYQDGYFIVPFGGTNEWALSALNDGATWPPGATAFIQSQPDIIQALSVLHRRLFIFGQNSTEVWINAGTPDFPFRRDNNLLLEYGCVSAGSVAEGYGLLFFLSGNGDGIGSVMMISGTQPQPISNDIDIALQNLVNPYDCDSFTFRSEKGIFYQINFNTDNLTFVFNAVSGRWHRLEMLDGSRSIANWHSFMNNKHYIGAYNSGQIMELSTKFNSVTLTNGLLPPIISNEAIHRYRISPHFFDPTYKDLRVNFLRLDLLFGYGDPNTIDEDPKIYLSISNDGGVTYTNPLVKTTGIQGNYRKIVSFPNLGTARMFTFKLETWTRTDFMILGASIDFEAVK